MSNPHTHSYERNLGNKQPSELQNTLHSTFGKEGKLSDFLSKVDTGPTVTSKNSRIRFQNHGAFSGNFEEQGKVFRFESVSSSLSEKIREEKNFQKTPSRWEIIDFRTSSFSNIISEKEPSVTLVVPSESEIKKEWNQTNPILQSEEIPDKFLFEEKEKVEQTDSGLKNECYEEESVDSEEDFSEEETLSSETSIEKDISENLKTSTISSSKEVSTKHTSSSPEEEKLEPGLPFPPTTLVPEVKSKRSIYHVPLKSLKRLLQKFKTLCLRLRRTK